MDSKIPIDQLLPVGRDLSRPESVRVGANGKIYCSDSRGAIMSFLPGPGERQEMLGVPKAGLLPNGIAPLPDGSFLVANLGSDGGLWHLGSDAVYRPLDIRVGGKPLPPVNFVEIDSDGRIWLSISTKGASDPVFTQAMKEGLIVLGDRNGFRVVASGLAFTNELRVDPTGRKLFVNETFGRRVLQYAIDEDGSLSNESVLAELGAGDYPDGMALDSQGGIWITSIISNRLYRIAEGECRLIFEDAIPEVVDRLEHIFLGRGLMRSDLHGLRTGRRVSNISSLAFGGDDLRDVYLGSLNDSTLWNFRSSIAGIGHATPASIQYPLKTF